MPSKSCQGCQKFKPIFARSGFCHACYAAGVESGRITGVGPARCSVDECGGWAAKGGLCDRHYRRNLDHGDTNKVRREGQHREYKNWWWLKAHGKLCDEWCDFEAFVRGIGERPSGRHWLDREDAAQPFSPTNFFWREPRLAEEHSFQTTEERRAYQQAVARENPGQYIGQSLKAYGLTTDDYHEMLVAQGGVCGGCGHPETEAYWKTGQVKLLVVDHHHENGAIRGLLCASCNKAVGFAGDDSARLRKLADYLDRTADLPPRYMPVGEPTPVVTQAGPDERACIECNASVEGKPKHTKFCSNDCRMRWHRRQGAHSDAARVAKGLVCTIEGCGKAHHSNGYCGTHYARFHKYGDPLYVPPKPEKQPCSKDGCAGFAIARGLCPHHYYADRRALRQKTPVTA